MQLISLSFDKRFELEVEKRRVSLAPLGFAEGGVISSRSIMLPELTPLCDDDGIACLPSVRGGLSLPWSIACAGAKS